MITYDLCDIVEKINGGGIIPVGETNYDNEAFIRMKDIEILIDVFVDDMLKIYNMKSGLGSIVKAQKEAELYLQELKANIDGYLSQGLVKKSQGFSQELVKE